jgi:hypothetical protein
MRTYWQSVLRPRHRRAAVRTRYKFATNAKTARALGIEIPQTAIRAEDPVELDRGHLDFRTIQAFSKDLGMPWS